MQVRNYLHFNFRLNPCIRVMFKHYAVGKPCERRGRTRDAPQTLSDRRKDIVWYTVAKFFFCQAVSFAWLIWRT